MNEEHPDLIEVSARLQSRFDAVLDAEREAAAVVARRSAHLRDRLLAIEDLDSDVTVWTINGTRFDGTRLRVGLDHIEIAATGNILIPIDSIEAVVWR